MKSKLLLSGMLCSMLLAAISGCSAVSEPSPIASFPTESSKAAPTTASHDDSSDTSLGLSNQQRNPYEIAMPQCGGAGTATPTLTVSSQGFITDPSDSFAFKSEKTDNGIEAEIINLNGIETQSGQEGAGILHNSGVIGIVDIPGPEGREIAVNILANGQGGSPREKTVLKDSYQAYEGAQGINPVDYIGYHDFNMDTPGSYEDAVKIGSSGCGSIIWHDNSTIYIAMLGNDYVKLSISFA